MSSRREKEREYDRIASARMRTHEGGVEPHVALGNKTSVRWRFRLKRMGADPLIAKELTKLVDDLALQDTLEHQSLGVRYAAVKREQKTKKVWGSDIIRSE